MSLFRKPKKIQRRVFSCALDDEEDNNSGSSARDNGSSASGGGGSGYSRKKSDAGDDMEQDDQLIAPPPPQISKKKNKSKSSSSKSGSAVGTDTGKTKALLSFADEEDDGEVFQVRKSSHSKKVMRMMDKERRRKKKEERSSEATAGGGSYGASSRPSQYSNDNSQSQQQHSHSSTNRENGSRLNNDSHNLGSSSMATATTSTSSSEHIKKSNKSDSIQTEIRTDDFVLVVKKSEPDIILNGRAAFCAGRDDMSDEDGDNDDHSDNERNGNDSKHRFAKPDHLKQMLESGSIPDAAMIHAARKRRQKAREQGDFIHIEEPKVETKKGSRLAREDMEGDNSDDEERMDMNAITGIKEREERREKFYAVEKDCSEEDSDCETNEWENQQIRKGVTGAQLVNAQHESVLSRFMIKSAADRAIEAAPETKSTSSLLEEAYSKCTLEKPHQLLNASKPKKEKIKPTVLRSPQEIREAINERLNKLKKLNDRHLSDIERVQREMKAMQLEEMDSKQKAPTAAAKYRFYQEIKCYVSDLVDCLNEKISFINDLEKRCLVYFGKHQHFLIDRRRQDVRDQAREMAEASKPTSIRKGPEYDEQIRRAAEREGRRTRRRCEREKQNMLSTHLDGMSSDEETSDRYQEQFQNDLEELIKEGLEVMDDVTDDFCKPDIILSKFHIWRQTDMNSYKDAFVSLCLPKILGPLIRLEMLTWSPLLADYKDIEKLNWYQAAILYAWTEEETEESLRQDPDVNLVPTLIEKIILPKITDIVTHCWDPLSTSQTLRLIGFINRMGRDYPLKENAKTLQQLFKAILEKMKTSLENDVFIPIFPKQVSENKTSFFQRQFCSGLKLFRNFLSWQGIIADAPLREMAIGSLLNRYLLLAMRVCTATDAISKAYTIVNTLPTAWLQPESECLKNLQLFILYIKQTMESCDATNPVFMQTSDKAKQILQRLHSS
ncbi:PAX3- and PAX7-binding protein 1 isoform X2 [Stomoxys calcitrans]|uniref:PAX3- and PAX7-binding protein 1 isoform X2 n=1 Tax=Stomoxys calcitrans TaxID=35570 RepID=UPI0027E259B1|nr:PAX3- and PAX7-binding protein 1 isoform X2 [Stomoxys calcitrans]